MANERADTLIRSWQAKETIAFWSFLIATLLLIYLTMAFVKPAIIGSNYIALISVGIAAGALAILGGIFLAVSLFSKSEKGQYDFPLLCSNDSRKMFFLLLLALTTGLLTAISMPIAFSSYFGTELLTATNIASNPLAVLISGPVIGALLILGGFVGFVTYAQRPNLAAVQPAPRSEADERAAFAAAVIARAAQSSARNVLSNSASSSKEDPDEFIQTNIIDQEIKINTIVVAVGALNDNKEMSPQVKHEEYTKLIGEATAALETMQNAIKSPVLVSLSSLAKETLQTSITESAQKVTNLQDMANNFPKPEAISSTSLASSSQTLSLPSAAPPPGTDQAAHTTSCSIM